MLVSMTANANRPPNAATTVEHLTEGNAASRPLSIDSRMVDQLIAHLRDWLPNEGCGLLASAEANGIDRAVHFFAGTNIDHSPARYTMDPIEVIAAMKRMREEHWDLAAIVHSHPRTRPVPSRTDLREWYYPKTRLMIISFAAGEPDIGCWSLADDQPDREFRPAPLVIEER